MNTRSPGLSLLFEMSKSYRAVAFAFLVLCVVASAFDGISIGLLVPVLGDMQKVEGVAALPGPLAWADGWLMRLPADRRPYFLIAFVIGAVVLKNVFIALSFRVGQWLSARLVADLRIRAVRRLVFAGTSFHDTSSPADLIETILWHTAHLELFFRMAIEFLANALTLVFLVALLFVLSWTLALLALGIGCVFLLVSLRHVRRLARVSQRVTTAEEIATRALYDSLTGLRLIKSYSRERQHVLELEQALETARSAIFRRNFLIFSIHPITDVVATLALAALVVVSLALHNWDTRAMLVHTLPFLFVLLRIVPLLKILNGQKAEVASRWPYLGLVQRLLQADHEPLRDGHKPFPGLRHEIRFHGVKFSYRGRPGPALKGITLCIPAGKTTAIIGASGSGKSTLAHLLLRLYDPQEGEITLDGEPLSNLRLASYHQRVGSVGQDTFLFNQTVRFNIAYGVEVAPSEERLIEAARRAQAHDFIRELPEGYDTVVGERGVQLSGGQRQRLAFARAILTEPEILILDEATSALDPLTERNLLNALQESAPGRTVIIIAHRASTIEHADRVVVLHHGEIIETRSRPQAVESQPR